MPLSMDPIPVTSVVDKIIIKVPLVDVTWFGGATSPEIEGSWTVSTVRSISVDRLNDPRSSTFWRCIADGVANIDIGWSSIDARDMTGFQRHGVLSR